MPLSTPPAPTTAPTQAPPPTTAPALTPGPTPAPASAPLPAAEQAAAKGENDDRDYLTLPTKSADLKTKREAWDALQCNEASMSKCVGDLLEAVFGKAYLSSHSMSGKKGSISSTKKEKADPTKIAAIKEIAEKRRE
ncbi:cyclin-dependent kinase inhibitor 1C-like [Lineus longissimus]|uniref:cyclin-dependent kinase inhibitor 1C-like n=1 Tax=Lineus longissimus TaxID=88925 RepID=UPI00315DA7DA